MSTVSSSTPAPELPMIMIKRMITPTVGTRASARRRHPGRLAMSGVVHALLVGIDLYPEPAHRLAGCRNDVAAFEELLTLRVKPERLRLRTLVDGQATRENVIGAFRPHLGRAAAADTVLFYYAGHGSRERSPEAFWTIEP